jgi:hypothetical protein
MDERLNTDNPIKINVRIFSIICSFNWQKTKRQLRVTWRSIPVSARSMSQRGEQKKDPSPRPSDKMTSSSKVEFPVTRNCERCKRHHLAKGIILKLHKRYYIKTSQKVLY